MSFVDSKRKNNILLILFIVLKTNVVLSLSSNSNMLCSRANSRFARSILKKSIYSLLKSANSELSLGCPLHPSRDLFRQQEQVKDMSYQSGWVCGYCGKWFYEEHFLDQHFDNRHSDVLDTVVNATCLDDYCDILGCDLARMQDTSILKGNHIWWKNALCRPTEMMNIQHRCLQIAKECSPPGSSYVRDIIAGNICSRLTCKNYWNREDVDPVKEAYKLAFDILFGILITLALFTYYMFTLEYVLSLANYNINLWIKARNRVVLQSNRFQYNPTYNADSRWQREAVDKFMV